MVMFFVIFLPALSFADGKIVTSKELSLNDITPFLKSRLSAPPNQFGQKEVFKEVFGVHQKGNEATVYYSYDFLVKGKLRNIAYKSKQLVRFNSGKWYLPAYNTFLTK